MKVICVHAEKGGTGKTTTAVHLADEMSHRGFKALLLDLDGQSSASTTVLVGAPLDIPTITDAARGRTRFKQAIYQVRRNLWAVPGDRDMRKAEDVIPGRVPALWLRSQLGNLPSKMFDYVIIDTPPAKSLATDLGLMASSALVVPVQLEPLPAGGLAEVVGDFGEIRSSRQAFGEDIALLGVVATMADMRLRQSKSLIRKIREYLGDERFVLPISRTVRVSEASGEEPVATDERLSTTVFSFAPDCAAAEDYRALCTEVLDVA